MISRALPEALAFALSAFPRRYEILAPNGDPYITRHVLWGKPALGDDDRGSAPHNAYVHELHAPDDDRHLHDHPWQWGVSLILSGGYTEERLRTPSDDPLLCGLTRDTYRRHYTEGDLNILRPGDFHRIVEITARPCVTLFLCGRATSDWGFMVDGRFVPHREYLAERAAQGFGAHSHTESAPQSLRSDA